MDNPFTLEGKRILVTGASSGIGRQIAISCSHMGASVVITGRDEARLAETAKALAHGSPLSIIADQTNEAERNRLVDRVGSLTGVVHCAGTSKLSPIRQATEKHITELSELNFFAPILLTQRLIDRGSIGFDSSILFISSIAAHIGVPGVGVYSGTKAAIEGAVRSLAVELAPQRIRVNCLAPSLVVTPLFDKVGSNTSIAEKEADHPLGFGTVDDVANAAIYFLSDASRWITGQALIMDGGYSAK